MAVSTTTSFTLPASASIVPGARAGVKRRITPQAGRALEILGHAIEYLTDELVHQGLESSAKEDQLEAVKLLMALNRQIYFECPEAPGFDERCRAWMHPC